MNNTVKIKLLSILLCFTTIFFVSCGSSDNSLSSASQSDSQSGTDYVLTKKETPLPVYAKTFGRTGGEGVMPIGSFCGPQIYQLNSETFQLIQECGIQYFASTVDATTDQYNANIFLDLCDEYGFGTFLTISALRGSSVATTMTTDKINNILGNYVQHDSFMGFELQDEPSAKGCEELSRTVRAFNNSSYSDLDMYYNALPDYASATSLSGTSEAMTYEEYMRAYIENLSAAYFSYDYYPFGKYGAIGQDYFKNMAIVRNISAEYGIPFWTFAQCGADFGYGLKECIPDEYRFRWNIATSLAYGAKGIQYFTLSQYSGFYDAIKDSDPDAHTRLGIFGAKNNINQWYYYAKDANAHIGEVDDILMNATSLGVIFHGTSIVTPSEGSEIIGSGSFRQLTAVEGSNSVIGCFDYKGGTALYVVNNSVAHDGTVTLKFNNNYCYDVTKKTETNTFIGKSLSIELEKGEGALVVLR